MLLWKEQKWSPGSWDIASQWNIVNTCLRTAHSIGPAGQASVLPTHSWLLSPLPPLNKYYLPNSLMSRESPLEPLFIPTRAVLHTFCVPNPSIKSYLLHVRACHILFPFYTTTSTALHPPHTIRAIINPPLPTSSPYQCTLIPRCSPLAFPCSVFLPPHWFPRPLPYQRLYSNLWVTECQRQKHRPWKKCKPPLKSPSIHFLSNLWFSPKFICFCPPTCVQVSQLSFELWTNTPPKH